MWREWTSHQRGETKFLKEAIEALASTPLPTISPGERELWDEVLMCPQSADCHAEGPFIEDHLKLMWQILMAVVNGELHLCDIEELRRLKDLAGELDEIEDTIKEKAASLEVFILCHDLGKSETVHFSAQPNSEGSNKKLHNNFSDVWKLNNSDRTKNVARYNEEYKKFATTFSGASAQEIHAAFFSLHQVTITHPGFTHTIVKPRFKKFFDYECEARRLTTEDAEDVFRTIFLQEKLIHDFSQGVNVSAHCYLSKYAIKYGRDVDDFLDLLLATLFLEVCASPKLMAHGIFYDISSVVNFLLSEHEALPGKREERIKKRQKKKLKIEREKFRQAKLDGNDLMKLFQMKPGREFGKLLAEVQIFAKNQGVMPAGVPETAKAELFRRIEKFRNL
jgi:hypothetical protein